MIKLTTILENLDSKELYKWYIDNVMKTKVQIDFSDVVATVELFGRLGHKILSSTKHKDIIKLTTILFDIILQAYRSKSQLAVPLAAGTVKMLIDQMPNCDIMIDKKIFASIRINIFHILALVGCSRETLETMNKKLSHVSKSYMIEIFSQPFKVDTFWQEKFQIDTSRSAICLHDLAIHSKNLIFYQALIEIFNVLPAEYSALVTSKATISYSPGMISVTNAIRNNDIKALETLIEWQKSINIDFSFVCSKTNLTFLQLATPTSLCSYKDSNKLRIFEMLLNEIPKTKLAEVINQKDQFGYTTLHYNVISGLLDEVNLLLSKEQDIDLSIVSINSFEHAPLRSALYRNFLSSPLFINIAKSILNFAIRRVTSINEEMEKLITRSQTALNDLQEGNQILQELNSKNYSNQILFVKGMSDQIKCKETPNMNLVDREILGLNTLIEKNIALQSKLRDVVKLLEVKQLSKDCIPSATLKHCIP